MFPAASGGNITPNMVRLHRDRHWDRQLQRKNGVWKYTNARSLLKLIPEKEVEKVVTLFPSHSKLSIPIPSCCQTPSLLCASGGVKGRKEQGLQDRDKTSTAPLTWRSEDGQLWKQGVELWVDLERVLHKLWRHFWSCLHFAIQTQLTGADFWCAALQSSRNPSKVFLGLSSFLHFHYTLHTLHSLWLWLLRKSFMNQVKIWIRLQEGLKQILDLLVSYE